MRQRLGGVAEIKEIKTEEHDQPQHLLVPEDGGDGTRWRFKEQFK